MVFSPQFFEEKGDTTNNNKQMSLKRTREEAEGIPDGDVYQEDLNSPPEEHPLKLANPKKKKKKNKKKKKAQQHIDEQNYDNYNYEDDELLMHTKETLPANLRKFWNRRYDLFSKFDEGIYMNEELWFSVTPESLAKYTAQLFAKLLPEATKCIDICCGGGGNTIQFAQYFDSVGAIDINSTNLYCTEHNAGIYGVRDKIWTLQGDWNELSAEVGGSPNMDWIPIDLRAEPPNKTFDFIYSSPPWGGTNYNRDYFDLYNMEHFPIVPFLQQMKQYTDNIGLYLPRSSDLDQLSQATHDVFGPGEKCRVIYINLKGRSVALLALFGTAFTKKFDKLDDEIGEGTAGSSNSRK